MFELDHDRLIFDNHPRIEASVGFLALQRLAQDPAAVVVIDTFPQRRAVKAGLLLALSLSMAQEFKKRFKASSRVGIVLPPGLGAVIANLGLFLAGKIPVNLNVTAPRASLMQGMKKAAVIDIITAPAMQQKFPDFPWGSSIFDLQGALNRYSKLKIVSYQGLIRILSSSQLAKCFNIAKLGGDREAALLLTSGSEGDVKVAILSHRNLVGNALQIESMKVLPAGCRLMASLPFFHSFGFTVTLIYPLLYSITIVTSPSPLEVRKISEIIRDEKVDVHLGTPAFFKPYLKAVDPSYLKTLRYVVSGADKTPPGLAEAWEARFGSEYLEGYGLTETSPVVCVNLPPTSCGEIRKKQGSVGRLFPGMTARIVCEQTGRILPLGAVGLLQLRGINIFKGYLNDHERTQAALHDSWLKTTDLARLDADGFLYIEGRLARFSKIGGEMISHGAIEAALAEAYALEDAVAPWMITAIPDSNKGESIILLTTQLLDSTDVQRRLSHLGLPNVWIPRKICYVEVLPTLASGKLDLKLCKALAAEGAER